MNNIISLHKRTIARPVTVFTRMPSEDTVIAAVKTQNINGDNDNDDDDDDDTVNR